MNLLTPGLVQSNEDKPKLKSSAPALQTGFAQFLPPQYLTAQQQYFAFNSAFFNAPFGQYGYTTGHQYLPHLVATLPAPVPATIPTITNIVPSIEEKVTTTNAPTTKRPNNKNREPTTRKPQGLLQVKPPKLQLKTEETFEQVGDFKSDLALLKAVEKINPEYVIEDIVSVPGQHVFSTETTEILKAKERQTLLGTALKQKQILAFRKLLAQKQSQPVKKAVGQKQFSSKAVKPATSSVKVESTGKTSTTGNIPEIPFGTYFLPYFSQNQAQQRNSGKKTAALILEPHSKAIVGNGGTAISTPISKAFLKRGVPTNVYFNPESVAIAGVGGKAHAQADLELDLIN